MTSPDADLLAAVALRNLDNEDRILLSDGRAVDLEQFGLSQGKVTLAWSPSGHWLGVRRGTDILILNAVELREAWRSEGDGGESCCWDLRRDRLVISDDGAWRSYVPVEMEGLAVMWLPETEDGGTPSSLGDLWVTFDDPDEDSRTRSLVMPPHGFAGSPLVELPLSGRFGGGDWAPDGSALAWYDDEGVKFWRAGNESARVLLRWRGQWALATRLWFSPDGQHLLAVLGELGAETTALVVIRTASGEATEIPFHEGPIGLAEWGSADEIYLAYDFVQSAQGGEYRKAARVRLGDLPEPWRLRPALRHPDESAPAAEAVRHLSSENGIPLDLLPAQAGPLRLELQRPGSGEVLCRFEATAAPGDVPVVAYSAGDCRCLVGGVSTETAGVSLWASYQPERPLPPSVSLDLPVGKSRSVPVVRGSASFAAAVSGVMQVAVWVRG